MPLAASLCPQDIVVQQASNMMAASPACMSQGCPCHMALYRPLGQAFLNVMAAIGCRAGDGKWNDTTATGQQTYQQDTAMYICTGRPRIMADLHSMSASSPLLFR